MNNIERSFEKVRDILSVYKKNKENIPSADLQGKYKKAFDKLRHDLSHALTEYYLRATFEDIGIKDEDVSKVTDRFFKSFKENKINERLNNAVKEYDLKKITEIMDAQWLRHVNIWADYLKEKYSETGRI